MAIFIPTLPGLSGGFRCKGYTPCLNVLRIYNSLLSFHVMTISSSLGTLKFIRDGSPLSLCSSSSPYYIWNGASAFPHIDVWEAYYAGLWTSSIAFSVSCNSTNSVVHADYAGTVANSPTSAGTGGKTCADTGSSVGTLTFYDNGTFSW